MTELEIKQQLKDFLCTNLGVDANELEFDTQLFGEGIGLDSIDSIELVAFIDETFGVSTTGIDKSHFYNIDSLAAYVFANIE
ncbi:MAG: acyl carrier protein [Erysipelotrichaceae bacterium]|nr:acyl carrier protein [Erysipelotrichaceae bacterium]